jgi:ATP/maltotriose-dependent transcriptional regulator MalT
MGRHPSRRHVSPDEVPVGRRIRGRRRDLGLTQTDLAAPAYTKSFISQIEGGHAEPSLDTLRFLGRRLHMSLSALAGDTADQQLAVLGGLLNWAQTAMANQRIESARRAIQLAREIAAETGSDLYTAEALLLQADLDLETGAFDRAEAALEEVARLPVSNRSYTHIRATLTRGRLALRRGDAAAATIAFRSAWGAGRKAPRHPDLAARATIGLAVAALKHGDLRTARRHVRSALNLAQRHRLTTWHGRALIVLAEINRLEGRTEEADRHLQEAGRALDGTDNLAVPMGGGWLASERALEGLV